MSYTNSPLVSYTQISPNKSSPRNHEIDTVSIHCVVGQASVQGLGGWFAKSSTQASSNYGIGYDGKIGMYVEEKDRSWCTSSSSNDNRAITIEVASDNYAPYKVTASAYDALIKLLVDICKRNSIKRLLWQGDKSLIGQISKQNMTVHRWFANKSCPGDYLYNLHSQIASQVNAQLGSSAVPVITEDTDKTIWDFLTRQGLNAYAVAGIMGNLYAESGLRSNNLQNSYEKSLGYTDEGYTSAVDSGAYTNFVHDSAGYGLVQWTYWTRKQGLLQYAKSKNVSIGDLTMQLEYLWKEIQGYTAVMNVLNSASSVLAASNAVLLKYEAPADTSESVQKKRAEFGQSYYDKFANATVTPSTDISIGSILQFTGGTQYISSNAKTGVTAKACKVKVTKTYKGKHPYHVRSLNESGNFTYEVYGWVDEATLIRESSNTPSPSTSDDYFTYTVISGDTLSGIAKKFGTTYQELAQFNNISNPNVIKVGQVIKIPSKYAPKKSNEEIAQEVINGKWGNGSDRKQRLTDAGYDYSIIQSLVNKLLS